MNDKSRNLAAMAFALLCGAALSARAQPAPGAPPSPPAGAAAPAISSAPPVAPPNVGMGGPAVSGRAGMLKELDGLLTQFAAASTDLKKLAAGGPSSIPYDESEGALLTRAERLSGLEKDCGARFTPANLSAVVFPNGMEHDVVAYEQCRAVVEKNAQACASLDAVRFKVGARTGLADNCRKMTAKLLFAPSVISHSPDAMDRCVEWAAQTGATAESGADNMRKVCELIVSRADAHAVAPQVGAILKLKAEEIAESENNIAALKGEEKACAKFAGGKPDKQDAENCQSFVAYRKAYAAKSASACGKSWQCRVMMARGGNCDAFGKAVATGYCHESSQEKIQSQLPLIEAQEARWKKDQQEHPKLSRKAKYSQLFQQKLAAVDALQSRLNQEIERYEPKNTQEFKRRKDRFVALRASVQEMTREFRGATSAKGAIKPKAPANPDNQ